MRFNGDSDFQAWLQKQQPDTWVAIAVRSALRVLPTLLSGSGDGDGFRQGGENTPNVLFSIWAISVAVAAVMKPKDSKVAAASRAAYRAARGDSSTYPHTTAATNAAYAAAYSVEAAKNISSATAWSPAHDALIRSLAAAGRSRVEYSDGKAGLIDYDGPLVAQWADCDFTPAEMMHQPLWHGNEPSIGLRPADLGPTLFETDPRFAFFARWYNGMVRGGPLPWDLQERVALIPEDTWEGGADAVVAAIEEIERELEAEKAVVEKRAPEFEPFHVAHLFENRTIVSAGAASLSATIRMEFERFRAETGLNQTPDLFAPLENLPPVLDRIADILKNEKRTATTEQMLREEIGRLNARVVELENALADARSECAKLHSQSWKKVAAWTVGSANLFGVLAAAVWTVSGDDVGARKRLETLLEYRTVFDEVSSGKSTAPTP